MSSRQQTPRTITQVTTSRGRVRRVLRELSVVLAILGGIAVVGGGLLFIGVAELSRVALITVAVGAVLLVIATVSSFVQVRQALVGRRGRFATNAIITIAAFTAIVILLSLISFLNSARVDTTATQQFTLAPQTLKVLAELNEPVKATAFFVPDIEREAADRQRADDYLFEFSRRSNGKFTSEFVDPEAEPARARQMDISQFPSVVFEGTESRRRHVVKVPPVTEQDFTSALLVVSDPKQQKTVYFLTGHNEKDINDTNPENFAFGLAARGIVGDNYQIRTVNLFRERKMPEDVAVLVIAGPTQDLLTDEVPILEEWLIKGGRALFLLDPNPPKSFANILAKWGVVYQQGAVVDLSSSVANDPRTPLIQRAQYQASPITQPLDATFFPAAGGTAILENYIKDPRKQPPWVQYGPFIATSGRSWLTKNANSNEFDPAQDIQGPVALAMAVTASSTIDKEPASPAPETPTRLVVITDSDFAANKYFHAYSNGDLLVNSVNWLAQDFSLISIRPKPVVFRQLVMTRAEFNAIRYASWFLLPGVIGLAGLVAWWRRR